jgi:hypothetical protein
LPAQYAVPRAGGRRRQRDRPGLSVHRAWWPASRHPSHPGDGDGELERSRQGLPEWLRDNVDTHCQAARGLTVVVGTGEGCVCVSPDGGASFALLTKGLPTIQCVALG